MVAVPPLMRSNPSRVMLALVFVVVVLTVPACTSRPAVPGMLKLPPPEVNTTDAEALFILKSPFCKTNDFVAALLDPSIVKFELNDAVVAIEEPLLTVSE